MKLMLTLKLRGKTKQKAGRPPQATNCCTGLLLSRLEGSGTNKKTVLPIRAVFLLGKKLKIGLLRLIWWGIFFPPKKIEKKNRAAFGGPMDIFFQKKVIFFRAAVDGPMVHTY